MVSMRKQSGFSLVELTIVLVILGLLVGGVLAGQSLIRAAELRAVSTEYSRWVTATQTFRDKYFALPGDMTNATAFWGTMTTCNVNGNTGTGTQTCNGNGDGQFTINATGTRNSEVFTFWQHLANAGLIEGIYTGIGTNVTPVAGSNVPRSKISSGAWVATYMDNGAGQAGWKYAGNFGNSLHIGEGSFGQHDGPLFRPQEAWNIDKKFDDGMPGIGSVRIIGIGNCTNATSVNDTAAPYDLSNNSLACAIVFTNIF